MRMNEQPMVARPSKELSQEQVVDFHLSSMSIEGRERIAATGHRPNINPLSDRSKREALRVVLDAIKEFDVERETYVSSRPTWRAIVDSLFGTGKETDFFDTRAAEAKLRDQLNVEKPKELLRELHNAELIEITPVIADSYSGAGSIAGMRHRISATTMGQVLVGMDFQPPLLKATRAAEI
ncbi:MAG: hypothetical protein KDD62_09680 [Bdellovibrionales bacterium]|nr:hypothetical protein [Bdellovibrionales bacterium]